MAIEMSLLDLIEGMPSWRLPEIEARKEDPSYVRSSSIPDGYVWPPVRAGYDSPQTPIVIITAPGAMGKTMAAEAIAARLKAPRVDLATMNVGSNSLSGMLFKVLGPADAAQFMLGLDRGHTAIVLDGLDEAQLRSGKQHFWSFLEDVASLLETAERARQVVMLGRPDATLAAELVFQDLGVHYEIVELQPLHREAAKELVRNTLDRTKIDGQFYKVHRVYSEPFAELERLVFDDLAQALEPGAYGAADYWASVAYFLGYPPVVQAVARRLATPNPQADIQALSASRFEAPRQSVERGRLLRQIVERILDRESDKVRNRVGEALGIAEGDTRRSILYTREEQTLRILSSVCGITLDLQLPAALTAAERSAYDDLVESFIPDHPLIVERRFANEVFADYARSFVTVADTAQLHGANRAELLAATDSAGPFLVHFVSGMTQSNDSVLGVVDESAIDDIIKSYTAGSNGSSLFILLQLDDSYTLTVGSLPKDMNGPSSFDIQAVGFNVIASSGVVELTSPVPRGTIVMRDNGLILSAPHGTLELGPDLVVHSEALEVKASSVVIATGRDSAPVFLSTRNFSGNPSTQVSAHLPSALLVNWPECWHPWKQYMPSAGFTRDVGLPSAKVDLVLVGLRRILTSFRQSVGADPSLYYEMLDNIVVGRNRVYAVVLKRLRELEVVERDGDLYRLRLSNLGSYGFAYSDLRGPNFATKLSALLRRVLESPELLSALNSV